MLERENLEKLVLKADAFKLRDLKTRLLSQVYFLILKTKFLMDAFFVLVKQIKPIYFLIIKRIIFKYYLVIFLIIIIKEKN